MNEIVRNAVMAQRARVSNSSMSDALGFMVRAPYKEVAERSNGGIEYTSTLFPKRKAAAVRRKIEAYASKLFDVAKCRFSLCEDDSNDDTWFWIAEFPLSAVKNAAAETVANETAPKYKKMLDSLYDADIDAEKCADLCQNVASSLMSVGRGARVVTGSFDKEIAEERHAIEACIKTCLKGQATLAADIAALQRSIKKAANKCSNLA